MNSTANPTGGDRPTTYASTRPGGPHTSSPLRVTWHDALALACVGRAYPGEASSDRARAGSRLVSCPAGQHLAAREHHRLVRRGAERTGARFRPRPAAGPRVVPACG